MILKAENHVISDPQFKKENNLDWNEKEFFFIQAADSQFGLMRRWEYVEKDLKEGKKGFLGWSDGPFKEWEKEKELSVKLVNLVNQMDTKPKFMIICGDMLDQFPYQLDEKMGVGFMTNELDPYRRAQYDDFIKIYSNLKIPLLCVCGNHDIGDKMTFKSVENYKTEFGDTYFKFYLNGVLFIALNSQLFFDPNECESLAKKQNEWLDNLLANEVNGPKKFKHVIVFQHHPLFIKNLDEESTFFNLPIEKRKFLFEKLTKAGIKKVFCGHYHANAVGRSGDFECIVTSAIGLQMDKSDNNGFRLVKIKENEISHQYFSILKDQPKLIKI